MKLFIKEEEISRGYFRDFMPCLKNISDYEEMPITCRVDGFLTTQNMKVVIEIKNRDKYYENWDTHLMEVLKYNDMCARCKNGIYVNFFGPDVVYLYNLREIVANSTVEKKPCKETSYDDDRCRVVMKDCYMINRKIAVVYRKINGEWIRLVN